MGIFKKPFYKNKTKEEFKSWFRRHNHWNKLDNVVIEAMIDKFIDDKLAFEVFIYVSENCKLIQNNYIPLRKRIGDIDLLLYQFSLTLYNNGCSFRDRLIEEIKKVPPNQKECVVLLSNSQDSYESCIKLTEFFISAYYQIAFLRGGILEKYNQGIDWCRKGLKKFDELRAIPKDQLKHTEKATLEAIEPTIKLFNDAISEYEKEVKSSA